MSISGSVSLVGLSGDCGLDVCYADIETTQSHVWYNCCDTPFTRITFTLDLRRKSLYYVINLIMPCCLFSIVSVLTFILQPSASERLDLGEQLVKKLSLRCLGHSCAIKYSQGFIQNFWLGSVHHFGV